MILILGLFSVYSLSSAVVRLSGWRFILPFDWVFYALYALGLMEILVWFFRRIAGWDIQSAAAWFAGYPDAAPASPRSLPFFGGFAVVFFLVGSFIPAREHLIPSLLPEYTRGEVCAKIDAALAENGQAGLEENFVNFCMAEETRVLKGYGIYRAILNRASGFYERDYDPWFGKQDYARLVFRLIGTRNAKVYIKTGLENARFPNGSIVYLVGREKNKFEAQFVLVDGPDAELIISSTLLEGEEFLNSLV